MRDERTGEPLRYRLNGLTVLFATLALWALACATGLVPWDWLWQHRWAGLAGACALGLVFSLAIVATAPSTGASFGAASTPRPSAAGSTRRCSCIWWARRCSS